MAPRRAPACCCTELTGTSEKSGVSSSTAHHARHSSPKRVPRRPRLPIRLDFASPFTSHGARYLSSLSLSPGAEFHCFRHLGARMRPCELWCRRMSLGMLEWSQITAQCDGLASRRDVRRCCTKCASRGAHPPSTAHRKMMCIYRSRCRMRTSSHSDECPGSLGHRTGKRSRLPYPRVAYRTVNLIRDVRARPKRLRRTPRAESRSAANARRSRTSQMLGGRPGPIAGTVSVARPS